MRVAIIGGAAIGSAIAYFLASDPAFKGEIVVCERDPSYRQASSSLSASSIRQQFSQPVNIAMSAYGFEFLQHGSELLSVAGDAPQLGLHQRAYLYLASAAGEQVLRANHALQRASRVQVELLEPAALRQRFGWLNCADLSLASLGLAGEGWFDGYALLAALRRKAISLGVRYLHTEVSELVHDQHKLSALKCSNGELIACDMAVNAAGAWSAKIRDHSGFELPVSARRRCVFVVSSPAETPDCPLVIDPSGIWFRPEGRYWLCGMVPEQDLDDLPLEVDYSQFEPVWETLAARVPAFEALRMESAWAGYYEYNRFDQNALIGPHPVLNNLLLATGFSGHGLQQSPAAGRAIAELIVHGGYRSLDLAELAPQRILQNRPVREQNII